MVGAKDEKTIEGRCMGCKATRKMVGGKLRTMKVNGSSRFMVCGKCEKCSTKMCRIIGADDSKKWK